MPWAKLGEVIHRWWGRPVLDIYFDPAKTYDTVRVANIQGNPLGYFTHFLVRNTGRTTAQRCRARLMSVSRIAGEGEVPVREFAAPRRLKWANESDFEPKDIEARVRRCDLAHGIEGSSLMRFFVPPEETAVGVQTVYPAGKYRVRVRVDCDNARHAEATLDITFTGIWNQITVTQSGRLRAP